MSTKNNAPLNALRHHVTGAIERGEAVAITGIPNMNTKHTPGSWYVGDRQTNNNTLPIYADIHIEPIASVLPRPFYADTQEANARLIAASPELLEALQRVACCADTAAHLLRDTAPDEAALFKKDAELARAAIAKATGQ